ncbi:MAG: hypothetical protein JW904_01375 [Spirochaetales bacterium]|nr:hypothetical protein [Spirochaetales bacterium]
MKKLIITIMLLAGLVSMAAADTIVTADVGYMVSYMKLTGTDEALTQHSLSVNSSIFIGDALKFFANISAGYIIAEVYEYGGISGFFDLSQYETAVSMDLLAGVGFRFFLSDQFLILGGVGVHSYVSLQESWSGYSWSFLTFGFGGLFNALFLIDEETGFNLGVKVAFDPLMASGTTSLPDYFVSNLVVFPYMGYSVKL